MKILILSCNTGEGHNSAGKAVMEAALLRGHEVEFMDLMLLGGKTVSHMVGGAYISIVRHIPAFFSLLYKVGGLISSSTRKSPVYYANSLLAGRLDRYIKEHSFDLILTPHLYAAEVLTCLKHRGLLSVPVIAIGLLWRERKAPHEMGRRNSRVTPWGARCGIVVGAVASQLPIFGDYAVIAGVLLSSVIIVIVSLLTKNVPVEKIFRSEGNVNPIQKGEAA